MGKIEYDGPGPLIIETPTATRTWTFPPNSGYLLSEEEYRNFKAMQQAWQETHPHSGT